MNMKKIFLHILCAGLLLTALLFLCVTAPWKGWFADSEAPEVLFRGSGKSFEICRDGQWEHFPLTGVNMGSGYPGSFPNDSCIPRQTYLRWFEMIAEMNANTIRVYQLQAPDFYSAVTEYNETHDRPLYLIQGFDFSDQLMYSELDLMDPATTRDLMQNSRRIIDALHGDALFRDRRRNTMSLYLTDVSPYVLGYTLGVEWDELFVEYVNRTHPRHPPYQGTCLTCSPEASAFESFLARWGDEVLTYETERYARQPMISFANWAETDPLTNEVQFLSLNQRFTRKNTENKVNIEHILPTSRNGSGLFAAYNIYPYYPLFLQYGPYTGFVDDNGMHNPYQSYLRDLVQFHSYPVLISEYGVPSCRSVAYRDVWRNLSHGGANETQQGQAIARLHQDIVKAGCAGSLVFTWQDEWFKRAWNEMHISDPDTRPLWSNAQCAEQSFGLLSFEPGTPDTIVYPDGDPSEWNPEDRIASFGSTELSMRSDEKYIYFLLQGLDDRTDCSAVNLALDVTPKSGAVSAAGLEFERPVDFLIRIGREDTGTIEVHAPYDTLIYSMGDKLRSSLSGTTVLEYNRQYFPDYGKADFDTRFHLICRARGSIHSMMRRRYELEEAGILRAGNGNPASPDFDSNTDYCLRGDTLELRIPWQLLNFRDPSRCLIVDDLKETGGVIRDLRIDEIHVCAFFDGRTPDAFAAYPLSGWVHPRWHERLKQSYYILQAEFKGATEDAYS